MGRVERAARVIDPAVLAAVTRAAAPVALAVERVLPVLPALAPLLPDGVLRRGAIVAVGGATGGGATSLALTLSAAASAAGSWVGVVGVASLGLLAAAQLGVAIERLLMVASPPAAEWATVVATLLDALDVVVVSAPERTRAGDARRLQARARERGAVLVVLGGPGVFEAEVRLTVSTVAWSGLEAGSGHLHARRVAVEATGRRAAARPRTVELWLPDANGQVRSVEVESRRGTVPAAVAVAG